MFEQIPQNIGVFTEATDQPLTSIEAIATLQSKNQFSFRVDKVRSRTVLSKTSFSTRVWP